MLYKEVEVRSWQRGEGCVFVEGELWCAASGDHLTPGDKAFVQKVDALVLNIASLKSDAGFHADARGRRWGCILSFPPADLGTT